MSTVNAQRHSAIEPRSAREVKPQAPVRRSAPDSHRDQGLVLAQIPDLDAETQLKVPEKRSDGRLISQALSIKVIFGVGLGLVVGAILPFIFGKTNRHETVSELPEWAKPAVSTTAAATPQSTAPSWPSSPTVTASASAPPQPPPTQSPAILFPKPPQVGDARPASLTEPAWNRPQTPPPPPAMAATPNYSLAPPPSSNPAPSNPAPSNNPGGYRGPDRPADPGRLQADNRNSPAGQYRNNDLRYDYRGAPPDGNPVRNDVPASGYPGDNRYPSENRYGNVNPTYPPPAAAGSPLMPSAAPGAPVPMSSNRDSQYSDPGVARFDGSITTPNVRTSYDRP